MFRHGCAYCGHLTNQAGNVLTREVRLGLDADTNSAEARINPQHNRIGFEIEGLWE